MKRCKICQTQLTDSSDDLAHAAYQESLCVRGYLAVMTVTGTPCQAA